MRAVLFIDRNSLYYYGGNIAKPISLAVPNDVLQDIEVIDDVAFKKILIQFLKKYAIKPALVMICFSSQSYFVKQLEPQKEPPDIPTLLSNFAEIVPFSHVLVNLFTFQKNQAIIALNKDLAYLLRDTLEPFGFKVEGFIPSYIFYGERPIPFSLGIAQSIIKQFSSLQQVSFPVHEEESVIIEADEKEFSEQETPKKTNSNLFIMIGVFGFLILVLIYMLFFFRKSPKKQPTVTQPAQVQVV
ncbi:MAG: hypothetical protein O3B87_04540, partial [bacterium]|nr:hypothetical protein [bacterium]